MTGRRLLDDRLQDVAGPGGGGGCRVTRKMPTGRGGVGLGQRRREGKPAQEEEVAAERQIGQIWPMARAQRCREPEGCRREEGRRSRTAPEGGRRRREGDRDRDLRRESRDAGGVAGREGERRSEAGTEEGMSAAGSRAPEKEKMAGEGVRAKGGGPRLWQGQGCTGADEEAEVGARAERGIRGGAKEGWRARGDDAGVGDGRWRPTRLRTRLRQVETAEEASAWAASS